MPGVHLKLKEQPNRLFYRPPRRSVFFALYHANETLRFLLITRKELDHASVQI